MSKFQIGDEVRIREVSNPDLRHLLGSSGVVRRVFPTTGSTYVAYEVEAYEVEHPRTGVITLPEASLEAIPTYPEIPALRFPTEVVDFARVVVEQAKQRGISNLSMTFRMRRFGVSKDRVPWNDEVRVEWSRGRHGAPAPVHITSAKSIHLEV